MSNSKILERAKITRKTGKWWTIPWWRDDKYYKSDRFTKDSTRLAFSELKNIFDGKWTLKQQRGMPNEHPVLKCLLTKGLSIFQYLVFLGTDLHNVRIADHLDADLVQRLKDKGKFSGAEFELKLLAHFLHNGFNIEKDYPSNNGKNCEFKVNKGIEVAFIEVTRPEDFCDENEMIIDECNRRFLTYLFDENDEKEAFAGDALSSGAEIKKLLGIIRKKREQLPEDGAGIIIIHTPATLWPASNKWTFEKKVEKVMEERYRHISAIVFVDAYNIRGYGIRYQTHVILNPLPNVDLSGSDILKILRW